MSCFFGRPGHRLRSPSRGWESEAAKEPKAEPADNNKYIRHWRTGELPTTDLVRVSEISVFEESVTALFMLVDPKHWAERTSSKRREQVEPTELEGVAGLPIHVIIAQLVPNENVDPTQSIRKQKIVDILSASGDMLHVAYRTWSGISGIWSAETHSKYWERWLRAAVKMATCSSKNILVFA